MKKIIVTAVAILVLTTTLVYNQGKCTTFGEAIANLVEADTIEKIVIQAVASGIEYEVNFEELLILEETANMRLKKSNTIPNIHYYIYIYTTHPTIAYYDIALGRDKIHIWDSHYRISSSNILYDLIENIIANIENSLTLLCIEKRPFLGSFHCLRNVYYGNFQCFMPLLLWFPSPVAALIL